MAPAGSKMLIGGRCFWKLWLDLYRISPTSWTVDYHNQVLVGSQHLRICSPFLATVRRHHYSHRTLRWEGGEDNRAVALVSDPLVQVSTDSPGVSDTAAGPVMPEPAREANHGCIFTVAQDYSEGVNSGYLTLVAGDHVRVWESSAEAGVEGNHFQVYVYGARVDNPSDQGWLPTQILRPGRLVVSEPGGGRVCMVTRDYCEGRENSGYLTVVAGKRVRLWESPPQAGWEGNCYEEYVYGAHVDDPEDHGWLPTKILRPC